MSNTKKQPQAPEKLSKKKLSKVVFEKLTGSLTVYHLKDKKLENRLEKVSRLLAGDIVKLQKKEQSKNDRAVSVKKAIKKKEVAVTE